MADANLQGFVEDFLADLKARGSSPNTINAYKNHLVNYANWCEETKTDFLSITPKTLKAFRNHMTRRDYNPHTVNMHLYALKSFYDFLVEEEIISGNPVLTRRLHVAKPKHKPAFLTDQQVQAILEYFLLTKFRTDAPDAVKIMLATGLRISEVVVLQPRDVVLQDSRIFVHVRHGKGDKERYVPVVDEDVAMRLLELCKERINWPKLLRVTKGGLSDACQRCAKATDIHFHAHRLRHTLATRLLAQGYPLDVVQEVLGHENIATTRRYAATLPRALFDVAAVVKVS